MMKTLLFLLIVLFGTPYLFGQISKTINVSTPGTLTDLLTQDEKANVTDLTVTGNIDSIDFATMKAMSQLANIDISACSVSGNRIPSKAFYIKTQIESVVLPVTVTEIGNEAFFMCTHLNQVILPQNLTKIGKGAFMNCNFQTIGLPVQLKYIDASAFVGCINLDEIHFPEGLETISPMSFFMTGIDSFFIPSSVNIIGSSALNSNFVSYISVDQLNNSYSSEDGVLFNKDKTCLVLYPRYKIDMEYHILASVITGGIQNDILQSLHIPASFVIQKGNPFQCINLAEITVSQDNPILTGIDNVVFSKDLTNLFSFAPKQNIKKYIIPSEVKIIHNSAFAYAGQLERVVFPDGLDSIGRSAFSNCIQLDSVVLNTSLKSMDDIAFYRCEKISSFKFTPNIDSIGNDVTARCTLLQNMVIPSSMKYFSYTNFNFCSHIDSVKINAQTPPEVGDLIDFYSIDTINCILYVPQGAQQAYENHPFWGAFPIEEVELSLQTSNHHADIDYNGGSGGFDIGSNTDWKISCSQNWVHFNTLAGIDNGQITITVDPNPGNNRVAGISIIGNYANPVYITLEQPGNPTANDEINEIKKLNAFVSGESLIIENALEQLINVYSMNGSLVLSKKASSDYETWNINQLPKGVYLLKVGNSSLKFRW